MSGLGRLAAGLAAWPSWLVGGVAALAGAGLAWWYFSGNFAWWHFGALAVVIGALLLLGAVGESRLPDAPVEAVNLIGFRTLATLLLATVGAAILIVIAAKIVAPEGAASDVEAMIAAVSAALTAAITASLVDAAESIDGPAASRAESAFKAAYAERFESNSPGRLAVFSNTWKGFEGWGYGVREKRAAEVARELTEPEAPTSSGP